MESETRTGVRPLIVLALPSIFLFLFVPSVLTNGFTITILVKNRWDALNLVLVSVAILLGLFARNPEDEATALKSPPSISPANDYPTARIHRSSSSYPDLRQEPAWWGSSDTADTQHFYDDVQLYRTPTRTYYSHVNIVPVDTVESIKSSPPPPPPPKKTPPPPLPPPPAMSLARVQVKKLERKKSSRAKDIATTLAHFYQNKKKKIHTDESVNDTPANVTVPPPPPPPPPPASASMFKQLFKKNPKRHNHQMHTFPPPQNNHQHTRKHKPRSSSSSRYTVLSSPPRPTMPSEYSSKSMGYYSIPVPPPPPPPIDEPVESEKSTEEQGQQFCPSPDVNNKAEMFIARFRATLQLEKLNSIKSEQEEVTIAAY